MLFAHDCVKIQTLTFFLLTTGHSITRMLHQLLKLSIQKSVQTIIFFFNPQSIVNHHTIWWGQFSKWQKMFPQLSWYLSKKYEIDQGGSDIHHDMLKMWRKKSHELLLFFIFRRIWFSITRRIDKLKSQMESQRWDEKKFS